LTKIARLLLTSFDGLQNERSVSTPSILFKNKEACITQNTQKPVWGTSDSPSFIPALQLCHHEEIQHEGSCTLLSMSGWKSWLCCSSLWESAERVWLIICFEFTPSMSTTCRHICQPTLFHCMLVCKPFTGWQKTRTVPPPPSPPLHPASHLVNS